MERINPIIEYTNHKIIKSREASEGFGSILDQIAAAPLNAFKRVPTEDDLIDSHQHAQELLAAGHFREAALLCGVSLLAASQLANWQRAEWILGTICRFLEFRAERDFLQAIVDFLDAMQNRFGFDLHRHSDLGYLTLHGNLCEALANGTALEERRGLFQQAVMDLQQALNLASQYDAPSQQVASIRLSLGRDLLVLCQFSGIANLDLLQTAINHLENSRAFFVVQQLPGCAMVDWQLGQAQSMVLSGMLQMLEEPALSKQQVHEIEQKAMVVAKQAVRCMHRALKGLGGSHPQERFINAQIMVDLGKSLKELSRVSPKKRTILFTVAATCFRNAAELWESMKCWKELISTWIEMADVTEKMASIMGQNPLAAALPLYERALSLAHQQGTPWNRWVAASRLGLLMRQHPGAHGTVDWQRCFQVFETAYSNLYEYVVAGNFGDEHLMRMVRQGTIWFWDHYLMAAGMAGRIADLAEVFERRNLLTSFGLTQRSPKPTSWKDIALCLPNDQAAVVYISLSADALQAVIVHRGEPQKADYICNCSIGWEDIRQIVDPWIAASYSFRRQIASWSEQEKLFCALTEMLKKLYARIWQQVEGRLEQLRIRHVFLIRGKGLNLLPFHAINKENTDTPLLGDYLFTYVSAGRNIADPFLKTTASTKILLVSNPTGDLFNADVEAELIAARLANCKVKKLSGSLATKAEVLNNMAISNVAHFGCHGFFELTSQGLVTREIGKLILSDGGLELNELSMLKLRNSPLVVLSACETGRVNWRDVQSLSISDYFLACGAQAVIATFWPVDDQSTALLMNKFYEIISQDPKRTLAAALRDAQLWLRDIDRRKLVELYSEPDVVRVIKSICKQANWRNPELPEGDYPYKHPYYWAPFYITTGN